MNSRILNARNFAAIAITVGLFAFAAEGSRAAENPLHQFAGSWSGGEITVKDGSSERIRF